MSENRKAWIWKQNQELLSLGSVETTSKSSLHQGDKFTKYYRISTLVSVHKKKKQTFSKFSLQWVLENSCENKTGALSDQLIFTSLGSENKFEVTRYLQSSHLCPGTAVPFIQLTTVDQMSVLPTQLEHLSRVKEQCEFHVNYVQKIKTPNILHNNLCLAHSHNSLINHITQLHIFRSLT